MLRELAPGLVLGTRYTLVRLLGEGGRGAVWLAEDREHGGSVALKLLRGDAAALAALEPRLEQLAALDLPGLLRPRALARLDGFTALVSDFLAGGDLGQFRGRAFDLYSASLLDVAATLETLHARGFVHRDLKCANVLLDARGCAWLADPDLLVPAGDADPAGLSPYHASPQQWRGEPALPADDRYAFGAMLYELACGHPPFYPELTRDKVLFEPPAPLKPLAPLPDRLRFLTLRLLAKDPEQRPATMAEVRAELERARAEPVDEAVPAVALPRATSPGPQAQSPPARRWPLIAALAGLAVGGAVFALLPRYVERRPAVVDDTAAVAAAQRRQAQSAAALEQARAQALTARDEFAGRRAALAGRGPERFATRDWQLAVEGAARAARYFEAGDAAAARAGWRAALERLDAVERAAGPALEGALARAQAALAAGRIEDARLEAALATALAPADARVKSLAARVGRWGDVLALLDAAAQDEQAGRTAAAAAKYRGALALDIAAPGAGAALARLGALQSTGAYEAAMSRGFAALAAGRIDAAKSAFSAAAAQRPGAPEPKEALRQIEQGDRSRTLDELRDAAVAAERAERWDEAVGFYLQAQRQEATIAFARDGLARSQPRAELARRLRDTIGAPQQLWSESGRGAARQLLARANAVAAAGPVLAADRRTLATLLAAAEMPVRIALRSDNQTDVVVYRVGRLGAFDARELELVPGRYTAVGTRNGYRDVRREFVIEPGKPPEPVLVRCEEPI
jgi:hypothetical protein